MERVHIILGGDNLNTLGIVRSLGEKGISPIIILYVEGHIKLVPHSKYAKQLFWVNSIEEGVALMYKYTSEDCRPFVYTTDDNTESYLDLHYDELIKHFYFYNAGESGRITHLMNKKAICDLAEECGFNVPKGEVVSRGELPKNIKYPVITKTLNPYSPGWKRDVGIYYSDEELAEAYIGMISEKLLLQEYIPKKNELQIRGVSFNAGEQVIIPYYSTLKRFTDTSFGGYHYYQAFCDEILINKVKALLRKTRYNGIFEIEFLIDKNNDLHFLEINFRSSAYDYADTFGNVNHPYIWSKICMNEAIDILQILPAFSAVDEVRDFCQFVLTKSLPVNLWLKDIKTADTTFFYNQKDPSPFYWYILSRIIKKLSKWKR